MRGARKEIDLARVMFADTVTARMLRQIAEAGSMPQAEFMRIYHVRCARDNPGKSSFQNNFGRYTRHGTPLGPPMVQSGMGSGRLLLTWTAGTPVEILARLTPKEIDRAFSTMESALLTPRDDDDESTTLRWLHLIKNASSAHANRAVAPERHCHVKQRQTRRGSAQSPKRDPEGLRGGSS